MTDECPSNIPLNIRIYGPIKLCKNIRHKTMFIASRAFETSFKKIISLKIYDYYRRKPLKNIPWKIFFKIYLDDNKDGLQKYFEKHPRLWTKKVF